MGLVVAGLSSLGGSFEEPVEDASTFAGNARLKAMGYAVATGHICIADDSGLSVDALDGRPGVLSARFAGLGGTRDERDAANNAMLLELMDCVPDDKRTARFECAVCVADPSGKIIAESNGIFEGIIARTPAGENGFGYDPLLYLPDVQKTSAQLSSQEKNARSHRGEAVLKIASCLDQLQQEKRN
jgi:XTP/dITP diphosphohydrolase